MTGLRVAQIACKYYFGYVVGVFAEEINILLDRLSKAVRPCQCEWVSFSPLRAQIEQKQERRACGILVCWDQNLGPWESKRQVLTTGLPGNSLICSLKKKKKFNPNETHTVKFIILTILKFAVKQCWVYAQVSRTFPSCKIEWFF